MSSISISSDYQTMNNASSPNIKVGNPGDYAVFAAKDIVKTAGMTYCSEAHTWSGTVEQASAALEVVVDNIDTLEWYIEGARPSNRVDQCRSHAASLRIVRDLLTAAIESASTVEAAPAPSEAPAAPVVAAPAGWAPCGYPGCNHIHCDECDGAGASSAEWAQVETASAPVVAELVDDSDDVDADELAEAVQYLEAISDFDWETVIGTQPREEFARLTLEDGQDIEDAWAEALAHAETL